MTLHATRDGQRITVHTTYGPVTNAVTEDAGHVRGFATQLGQLLDAADEEREERAARHHGHPHNEGGLAEDIAP
jgi:hypothetical protein